MALFLYCMSTLTCTRIRILQYYMTHASAVNVRSVLRKAYRMPASTPTAFNPVRELEPFRALVPLVNVSREVLALSEGAAGSGEPLGYCAPSVSARDVATGRNPILSTICEPHPAGQATTLLSLAALLCCRRRDCSVHFTIHVRLKMCTTDICALLRHCLYS